MSISPDLETPLASPVLLLAMPQVLDPYFHRTVVLLLRHEEEGSFGFIVNRPTDTRLTEILEEMEIQWGGREDARAHFGGPVQPQLGSVLFVPEAGRDIDGEATSEVLPGLMLTHHVGDLQKLAADPPERFRLLLGYAAWGTGQLMEEILRNDWLTAPADPELVFSPDPERAWSDALSSVGINPEALPSWTAGNDEEAN
jgi:putative transcriptional regulator